MSALPLFHRRSLGLAIALSLAPGVDLRAQAEPGPRPEELIVTATRVPRAVNEIAGTVTVVSAAEMQQQLVDDLDDLVRYQPGITMNTAGRGGNQGFTIRGIDGNRVLMVVDGIRTSDIYAAGPASYGKDAFEVDDLAAVEIVRGPASVLYGADAMGGAVLLRTKSAEDYLTGRDTPYVGVRTAGSTADDQYKVGFTGAANLGPVDALVQFTHRSFQEPDINSAFRLNPADGESHNLLVKAGWRPTTHQRLELVLDTLREVQRLQLDTELSTSVTRSQGRDETQRQRIGLQHTWDAGVALFDTWSLGLQYQVTDALQHTDEDRLSFSFVRRDNPASARGTQARRVSDFAFNQATLNLSLNLGKSFATGAAAHTLVYGLQREVTHTERPRNRCDIAAIHGAVTCNIAAFPFAPPETFPNKTFPDTDTRRTGLYVQDEIRLGDSGLTLVPGIRYDRYQMDPTVDPQLDGTGTLSGYGFAVTPVDVDQVTLNLGALYSLSDAVTLFAQYAEGYRPPNFDESNQAFVNLGFRYAQVPNPDLRPESSRGLEVGVRASLAGSSWSLAVYDNRYEDFIESASVGMRGTVSLFQDRNISAARIRGAELTSTWFLGEDWQLRGSLAYARGDNLQIEVPLDSIDPLTGVLGLRYAPSARWGAEAIVTAVAAKDRVSAPDRVTADGYRVLDLLFDYELTAASRLQLGVFNVGDAQYARWANLQGLAADNAPAIGRAQQVGRHLRASFNISF